MHPDEKSTKNSVNSVVKPKKKYILICRGYGDGDSEPFDSLEEILETIKDRIEFNAEEPEDFTIAVVEEFLEVKSELKLSVNVKEN